MMTEQQVESGEQYRKQYSESSKPSTSFRQVSQLKDFGARRQWQISQVVIDGNTQLRVEASIPQKHSREAFGRSQRQAETMHTHKEASSSTKRHRTEA